MFFAEPAPTAYDLRFHVGHIPVRVHPLFWLVTVLLGLNLSQGEDAGINLLLWILVVFSSILVHEMGHAAVMRWYGKSPRVVLYMLGGLAISDSRFSGYARKEEGKWSQVAISVAGPVAGFVLAAVTVVLYLLVGGRIELDRGFPFFTVVVVNADQVRLATLVSFLLYVNIFWGLINLVPVYPLDGGQIARELLVMRDPWQGIMQSLWLSVFCAAGLAVLGLLGGEVFLALLFGSLAYSSYMMIQQLSGGGGLGGGGGGGFGGGGRPRW